MTPIKAIIIDRSVIFFNFSPKTKYPAIAAIKGIAANINKVTAAVVIVIEKINPVKDNLIDLLVSQNTSLLSVKT